MATGTVKFFNVSKGFGFIKDEETNSEIFVHATGLIDKIQDNDQVSYEIVDDKRGKKAIDVRKA
jgi:CspA family cold shock protein